jgi:hypothetical protein
MTSRLSMALVSWVVMSSARVTAAVPARASEAWVASSSAGSWASALRAAGVEVECSGVAGWSRVGQQCDREHRADAVCGGGRTEMGPRGLGGQVVAADVGRTGGQRGVQAGAFSGLVLHLVEFDRDRIGLHGCVERAVRGPEGDRGQIHAGHDPTCGGHDLLEYLGHAGRDEQVAGQLRELPGQGTVAGKVVLTVE